MDLHGRSLLKETDLTAEEFLFLVDLGRPLRADKRRGVTGRRLAGRNIALIFEKTSTRTRSRVRGRRARRGRARHLPRARANPSSATRSR